MKTVGQRAQQILEDMKDNTVNKQVKVAGPYELIWQEMKQLMEYTIVSPICQGTMPQMHRMQDIFTRFGSYEIFCQEMDAMFADESYYKNQYEELEIEKEQLESDIVNMKRAIRDVSDDLSTIGYQVPVDDIERQVEQCIKDLDTIVEDGKVKKRGRK